jgi:putative ABC transport system permease protein
MNIATYARRNLFRRRGRTIMTIVVVMIVVLIFSLIRTMVGAWNVAAEESSSDRLASTHKVSFTMQLPKRYISDVRAVPGVEAATWANWFGAKDPQERVPFFAGLAVDHESWFDVMDEMSVPADQLAEWKKTPNGAILGDVIAQKLGVKIGDRLVITSDIYPGDWEFKVVGIYEPLRKTVDRSSLVFRWDYLSNDPRAAFSKDTIGWMMSRITDITQSAEISKRIDGKFEERDDQTSTMSERAFNLQFLGAFSAVLRALNIASLVILLIMTLILANTIAMSVRERTHEYGVLRAIGFPPGHVFGFIVGESLLIAAIGGVLGLGLVALVINNMIGPFIEVNMGAYFPYFRASLPVFGIAFGSAVVLGTIAGAVPARRASRLQVTDALRRLD